MTFQAIPERQSQAGISKGFSRPSPRESGSYNSVALGPIIL